MIEVFNGTEMVGPDVADVVYLWTEGDVPCYVGYTNQYITQRIRDHLKGRLSFLFQRKLRKRPDAFKCYIIAHNSLSLEQIHVLEESYIKKYNTFRDNNPNGYNLTTGGEGCEHSMETKMRIAESMKGKPNKNIGRKHSIEARVNMSRSKTGKPTGRHGIKHSMEARKRMSEAHKGKKRSPFSPEHKKKMSDAIKRRWVLRKNLLLTQNTNV